MSGIGGFHDPPVGRRRLGEEGKGGTRGGSLTGTSWPQHRLQHNWQGVAGQPKHPLGCARQRPDAIDFGWSCPILERT